MKKYSCEIRDIAKSLLLLVFASLIGFIFYYAGLSEANIIMVYILAVLITSIVTTYRIYSLVSSFISVIVYNLLFTDPIFSLRADDKDYPVTFVIMFIAAFLTGSLAVKLKKNAREKEEAALLAQKEQLRANLLRSISHDLRTPLTAISGNSSILLENADKFNEETKKQLYTDIYDDSQWLINLVENILSISKMEEGTLNLNLSAELLDEIIAEAMHHIDRRKTEHRIVVGEMEELLLVRVDARLITQVVINLIDNAIKYTQEGSDIIITAKKQQGQAVVSIADNGPGIDDEMKPYIFDMFYTGAKKVADSRRSLGLGLSLCKSILNAHGGEIMVTDNQPRGTVFTFTLPLEEVEIYE